ncbi:MAG: M20/M25/M40 family metallo-hydrolase, partial [Phycisphaerales bacterium]
MNASTSLSPLESHIASVIASRRDAMIRDLRELVEIPTGPGGSAGLATTREWFSRRLAALGATLETVPGDARPAWLGADAADPPPPTLIARGPGSTSGKRVLLAGHLDTVHPSAGSFKHLEIQGDRALGPGVVDMKGGLVLALHVLEVLTQLQAAPPWGFVLNADEETGSFASDATLRRVAREFDFGIALEPAMANGGLVTHRPGSGQFMLEVRGRAAHVGRDFAAGISAVNALAACITRIAALPDATRGIIASIGPISGGHATNVVPDLAHAWGNIRFPTPDIGQELAAKLSGLATPQPLDAALAKGQPHITVHIALNRPAKPLLPGTQTLAAI